MENLILSNKLIEYLYEKKKSNIVIYRDAEVIGCCAGACVNFVVKAKVQNEKMTNELFKKVTTKNGISIWVELGILKKVKSGDVFIDLGGFLKRLKISFQTFEKGSKQKVNLDGNSLSNK